MTNMNDEEIMKMVSTDKKKENIRDINIEEETDTSHRNLLIIGCGDGGCNIASEIGKAIADSFIICYNTSTRNMGQIRADVQLVPEKEDGSGKSRDYSKEIFLTSHKQLLSYVQNITNGTEIEYIVFCTTADGGTGSGMSPMAAKLVADNVDIPVIIIGVYPNIENDAIAQYNAIDWQREVTKTKLPYMIFDNSIKDCPVGEAHRRVNGYIVNAMKLISGMLYDNNALTIIDNRDFYMLIQHIGKRINIATSTVRPTVNQTLDDYIEKMLKESYQPMPENVGGIGIFLKGDDDLLSKLDPSLTQFRAKYGDAAVHYSHIETSDKEVCISILTSGSSEPVNRIYEMRGRYDDIMNNQNTIDDISESMLSDISNPFGTVKKKDSAVSEQGNIDLSALNIF